MEDWRRIDQLVSIILAENNQLFIPGLGTIRRETYGAKLEIQKNQFIPPSVHYSLDRSLHYDDPYLSELFGHYEQISLAHAEAEVYKYGTQINRQLILKGESTISGFGRLYLHGNEVSIDPGTPFQLGHRLPTIDLDDIWVSSTTAGPKELWWEFSAFVGILVLVLGYIYYLFYGASTHTIYPYSEDTPALIGETNQSDPNGDVQVFGIDSSELAVRLLPLDTVISQDSVVGETYTPIIIVGVFENPANIKRMSRILKDKGWDVYRESINGKFVRLGLIPEEHENIEEVLGLVRKNIEPGAWLLVKEH